MISVTRPAVEPSPSIRGVSDRKIARAFEAACLAELRALKPGNVHDYADGHDMTVEDFEASAAAAAPAIARSGASVGARIEAAVEATWSVVDCNTNLGIILLCAPLAVAAEGDYRIPLARRVAAVLDRLTIDDAAAAFRAIARAKPAGLGKVNEHDVHDPPKVTLLEAMRAASGRDMIARQYVTGLRDIFWTGLRRLAEAQSRGRSPEWVSTEVFFAFLARALDSHIVRGRGAPMAEAVMALARGFDARLISAEPEHTLRQDLLDLDDDLKKRGLNPGTSADLTVATLFAWRLAPNFVEPV